jgi:hypothetical protein
VPVHELLLWDAELVFLYLANDLHSAI